MTCLKPISPIMYKPKETIGNFNFETKHTNGSKNIRTDYLSRAYRSEEVKDVKNPPIFYKLKDFTEKRKQLTILTDYSKLQIKNEDAKNFLDDFHEINGYPGISKAKATLHPHVYFTNFNDNIIKIAKTD